MRWSFKCLLSILWISSSCFKATKSACKHPAIDSSVKITYPSNADKRGPFQEFSTLSYQCTPGFRRVRGDNYSVCIEGTWQTDQGGEQRDFRPLACREKPCPIRQPQNGTAELSNKNIVYSCNRGYQLVGRHTSRCLYSTRSGNYVVEHPVPECIRSNLECETPQDELLIMHGDCCYPGDTLNFTCDSKRRLHGTSALTCMSNGEWSGRIPTCVYIKTCKDPGFSRNSIRRGECCQPGNTLTYRCNKGYEFLQRNQQNSITCLPTERWSHRTPKCKPLGNVTCPDLPLDENNLMVVDVRDSDIYLPWEVAMLGCLPNYTSDAETLSLMCQEDGQWDASIPYCRPLNPCTRPEDIQNGRIIELVDNPAQLFPIGFEINIECDAKYEVKSNNYGSRCLGNNIWNKGISTCTLITCKDPGVPANGNRRGDNFRLGKLVTFSCVGDMTLIGSSTRMCLESKRWSGSTPVCDAGYTDCHDPGTPLNSKRRGKSFNVRDVVTYACYPNHMLIGNKTRVCTQDGTWTGNEIQCIAPDEYPDKAMLIMELEGTITEIARMSPISIPMQSMTRSGGIDTENMKGVNIYFLFDASGSITTMQFDQSKELAKALIRKVGISSGSGGIRVGAIVFSQNVTVKVYPGTDNTLETVLEKIHTMKREGLRLGTNIAAALDSLLDSIAVTKRNQKMKDFKNVIFLMTDGNINEGGHPERQVKELSRIKADVYVVAIGDTLDMKTLLLITKNTHSIIKMADHKQLFDLFSKYIGNHIDYSSCGLDQLEIYKREASTQRHKRSTGLTRVVGGDAVKFSWPWMAAIYRRAGRHLMFNCGGSIINSKWILSAAHCFVVYEKNGYIDLQLTDNNLNPRKWVISLGRVNLADPETGLNAFVNRIICHNGHNNAINYSHDIALVELVSDIQYDIFTRPICLPPPMKDLPQNGSLYKAGEWATVTGWGHSMVVPIEDLGNESFHSEVVSHLQQLQMPLQSSDICKRLVTFTHEDSNYTIRPDETSMCAGTGLGGEDVCFGDSGGPLMQFVRKNSNSSFGQSRWFHIGTVSWGIGCGVPGYYGYFSNTAMFRDWILENTRVQFEDV